MTTELKLTKIGDETMIALPREVLERLHVTAGDSLQISETEAGVALRRCDAESDRHDRVMEIARRVMREDHDVLRRLAE